MHSSYVNVWNVFGLWANFLSLLFLPAQWCCISKSLLLFTSPWMLYFKKNYAVVHIVLNVDFNKKSDIVHKFECCISKQNLLFLLVAKSSSPLASPPSALIGIFLLTNHHGHCTHLFCFAWYLERQFTQPSESLHLWNVTYLVSCLMGPNKSCSFQILLVTNHHKNVEKLLSKMIASHILIEKISALNHKFPQKSPRSPKVPINDLYLQIEPNMKAIYGGETHTDGQSDFSQNITRSTNKNTQLLCFYKIEISHWVQQMILSPIFTFGVIIQHQGHLQWRFFIPCNL